MSNPWFCRAIVWVLRASTNWAATGASVCLWGLGGLAWAQGTPPDSVPTPRWQHVVSAPPLASRLGVDEEGNLLVLCRDANRLYKYLHSASYDSLISLGGNALGREGLNQPTELWAHDRQTTYVLDAGNRRLVLVNPNLRVVRYVDFLATPVSIPGEPPLYITPAAVASNALGELFVLNQDDNRIFKFDRFGQFELVFGGPDWGEGRLLAPTQLLTNDRQWVYVSEPEQHRVLVFDNFGTFREPIPVPDSLGPWQRMVCMSDAIGVVGTHQLALWRPTAQQWLRFSLADAAPVTDAVLTVRGVYVLSGQGNVLLFKP